ncbi:MAG: metal ABC transporter substrate-binding protein [Gammaproteobacteria bacterium]|jgi:zinc transport system substrate-binding protein
MTSGLRLFILALILVAGVASNAADRLTVYTANYPLAYFADRIGGEHVDVVLPMPPDVDPAFWQPDAAAVAGFQRADLILLNGADYAKWLKRASLPRRKLINTSEAFEDEYITIREMVTHQHGPGGEHVHAGTAFTTWLDFSQAIEQARAIEQALVKKRPALAETFGQNFRVLEQQLNSLDQTIMAMAAKHPEKLLMASHPIYQYFARRYNIKLQSVMWEPQVVPDQSQWHALQRQLDTYQAEWMIWEGTPDERSTTRLKSLGLDSLVFDPCANTPATGDFMTVMKRNIVQLEKAFQP